MVAGTPALTGATDAAAAAKARLVVVGDTNFASNEFIDAGRIEPMTVAKVWPGKGMKGVA